MAKNDPVGIEERWSDKKIGSWSPGHDAKFGQDRLKNVTKEDFLDGLLAQGVPMDFLKQFAGDPLPNITSILLRSGFSRSVMDRAYNIAKAYQGEGQTGGDLSKLSDVSRFMYHIDLRHDPLDTSFKNKFSAELRKAGKNPSMEDVAAAARRAGLHPGVLENARHAATNIRYDKRGDKRQINVPQHETHRPFAAQKVQAPTPPGGANASLRGNRGQGAPSPGQPGAGSGGAGPGAPAGIDNPITLGGVGAGAGAGTPAPVDTRPIWQRENRDPTPEEFDEYVHDNFGAQAWFMDVPEVKDVIWGMAKEGLTDGSEAQRRVSQTQWFKNTSAAARTWHAHERADPATAQADIAEQTQTFITLASKMGITIPEDRIRTLAVTSMRYGWNQDQINKALAKEFRYDPANKVQSAKVSEMKSTAQKYLVPLADATIDTWARGLLSGEFSDEQFGEYLKGTAKSLFPQLAQAIDSGVTVEDYVNPYKQIAAQRLELPPDAINFMDTKWKSALDQIDSKTGQKRIMTLSEWEAHIKKDPTYGYDKTQQGVDEAAKLANDLLQKFGQVA